MRYVIPLILYTCFVFAAYFAIDFIRRNSLKYSENKLFLAFCISSAVWSFGFCGVFIQTTATYAYVWRAIGMIGTFGYLIFAQLLICNLAGVPKKFRYPIECFSYLGIIIYFFIIQKDQATYHISESGISYSFTPGIWNNLYTTYTVITAIVMFIVAIHLMITTPLQRLKAVGSKFLITEAIIALGMVFDTILPLVGIKAFPGSSISQFLGLLVMYNTINYVAHSRVNLNNMSEFIYYSLTIPVLVYDSKLELQIMNDNAYSFFDLSKDNIQISGISPIFDTTNDDVFEFEGKSQELDAVCIYNQSYCSLSVNKIYDDYNDIIGYIIIVSDLSERMKNMKNLEDAKMEAERANQAKSVFLANMSHEIRTPMNAIVGFSELVLKMDIDEEVRKHVHDIKWSSHNLLAIINDILDISKIESGKMELVMDSYFTNNFFNDIMSIINTQAARKGLEFIMEIDQSIPKTLYGDKIRLRGILINILNNAIKYTNKGSVTFKAKIHKQDEKNIILKFKIIDTGVGIKPENIDNLFKNFERLDQQVHYGIEGSGLGLAIAHDYITLMGGNITVDSVYGEGSTFVVTVEQEIIDSTPLGEDFVHQITPHNNSNISDMKIYNLPVLVTDDNLINLRVAHGILSYYGLDVDTASTGRDAIEMCRNKEYALVFMDQMMPEIDGIQAMKRIRQISPHYESGSECKIIVLTADAIKGTREHLLQEGFDEYLGKPMNIPQLERLFKRYIPEDSITYESASKESRAETSSHMEYLRKTLSGVEIKKGILNCGGDVKDYIKILKITYDYGPKQLAELKSDWEAKNYDNYIIKIHSLKSTSLNIGAIDISTEARKQEELGREGNYEYIDNHMQYFQDEYNKLLDKLKVVLEHYNLLKNSSEEEFEEVLDDAMVRRLYQRILRCIDDFDFVKVFEILEEMRKYKLSETDTGILENIANLMEDLSVDEIRDILTKELSNNT